MKTSRRHALGQHFLRDRHILDRIAAALHPAPGEFVLEIGSGKGPLTTALAGLGARVVAVEKDRPLAAHLRAQEIVGVDVVEGDILDFDWPSLMRERGAPEGPFAVAGNLPFSISSPVLFRLVDPGDSISRAVFLIQKEVASRITAGPGTKDYAPLGILLQIRFEAKVLFPVRPGSFIPPPRVESAVVSLVRREKPLIQTADETAFRKFLHAAFAQRRKTLANNLLAAGHLSERISAALAEAGLDSRARAEEVPIVLWESLYPRFARR